jgi:hypothetical protein
MTWGQLRLLLQTTAPDISLDLLDEWLNTRYGSVLEATDWTGLKAHATIQTEAAYQSTTDTVTVTVGGGGATGAGTSWTSTIVGQRFYIPGDTVTYLADILVSATELYFDRPYEGKGSEPQGTVYAGSPYVLMQNVYTLPADCNSIVSVLDPITNLPLQPFTKDGLDQSVGSRATIGYPKAWAPYDDSPEASPPVLRQIELYPPPLEARGFPLEYLRLANQFTGENTSTGPLPFVTAAVLLAGVRADIAVHKEKLAQAAGYEAQFGRELARMLLVDHAQRRVKTSVKMADRFTRHRMARASRGYGRYGGMPNPPTDQP